MKYLKSSLTDLRRLFDGTVTARYLAEPFVSFDGPRQAAEVIRFMEEMDFDVVGVRKNGEVVGYVSCEDLAHGTLDDHRRPFAESDLLDESVAMVFVLKRLAETPRIYLEIMGQVSGIITKGDLQKAPVRMWLFGLLSLIVMQLLRLVRISYPHDSWTKLLSDERVQKARQLLEDRCRRNEAIDLADCLQFADKRCIVAKTEPLRTALGFTSREQAEEQLKNLEQLRNDLAHSQDIISGRWPELAQIAMNAEQVLQRCEAAG